MQAAGDDRWRTLDSRALFRVSLALSELHHGLLMDRLSAVLAVGWEPRQRRYPTVPRSTVMGVPEPLLAEFSTRGSDIVARKTAWLRRTALRMAVNRAGRRC